MALLEVSNLKKEFNGEPLFHDVNFNLNNGEKMAIIGNNGVGKTTILKMILKELDIDEGTIHIDRNATVGYLSQVMISSFDNTLYQEMLLSFEGVLKLGTELKSLEQELSHNPNDQILIKKYGELETRFTNAHGYDYEYLIAMMTSKFGFSKEDYSRKISEFSGGERNKIAFTKLLLNKPDLLILDEPTNHLDVETVEWLEDYLKSYEGSVLIVTHDRYFIDAVCDKVVEIANHTSDVFNGNYSYYLNEKVLRYEQQLQAYNLQQKEIEHLETLIKKFKPKPTKVALARDREKKLARILDNKIDAPKNRTKKVAFNLRTVDDRRVRQFTLSDFMFGYDKPLAENDLNLSVFFGDKIGIIGPNGIGKTTLLKTIAGMLPALGGKMQKHRDLRMGYIDQNQIQISSTKTVYDYFHDEYPSLDKFDVYHKLGAFLFTGEDALKEVNSLSGGEKVRLSFAKLMMKKYDILLLDEPTNHLDMDTRKVLESALREYPGTIIFVSHDRYFIDELAAKLIVIKNNAVTIFAGDYASYQRSLKGIVVKEVKVEKPDSEKVTKVKTQKKGSRLSPAKLEAKIAKLEDEIDNLQQLMYEEEYYTDSRKMEELDNAITDKKIELDKLTEEYLEKIQESE
ncbi:MAG: ABC-F family ATP-binding cassette domain-containing protein [Bacilli bacterium]|nr:ABC-F family ATP-binding cassette domain-containing protein [Bacilli bacterium]